MFVLRIVKGREHAAGAAAELRLPPAPAKVAIGRDPHVTWPLPDRTLALSARHCEIIVGGHGAVLRDLSTNGTFVNGAAGRMMQDHALAAGDEFDLGPYRIVVEPMTTLPAADPDAASMITLGGASLPDPPPVVVPLARGADPAAALGAALAVPVRPPRPASPAPLAPPAAEHDSPVTRIRPPPRPLPVLDTPVASAPVAPVAPVAPAAQSAPAAPSSSGAVDPTLAALAAGLGVDAQALAGRDALELARRTGLIARMAVTGLRRLLEQEARARRRLGSRQTMAQPLREASPLRMARTPDDAVLRLLVSDDEATDAMREACLELLGHHERLQVAFAGAARRLGQDLEPASLDAALGPAGGAPGSVQRKAELWDLYVHLWQALGMASDEIWTRGFIDAAMVHLTSAYDEGAQDQEGAR